MKKVRKLLMVLMVFTAISTAVGCGGKNQNGISKTEISPIIDQDGADPFVTMYNGKYLYTKTTGGNICLAVADSIQTLGNAMLKCVYDPKGSLSELWAPEIWNLDDVWYIYFAATIPGDSIHHMFVLRNESKDPMEGEWQIAKMQGMDNRFAIDGTVMELDGKRYFLWSGWEGLTNVRQDIYIAEMVSPWELKHEKIMLTKPELDWEKNGNPLVNEGPEVIVRENTVNLVYSASGSWTDDYCLGLLTMEIGNNPKDPSNWRKHENPILSKEKDVYGPGHNCFVKSLDQSQDLIIYHATRWGGAGWNRNIRYGYVSFDEAGEILPITPVSGNESISIPSGEKEVIAYAVSEFGTTTLNVSESGEKIILLWVSSKQKIEGEAGTITVKMGDLEQAKSVVACENPQPVFFMLSLQEGANEITIGTDNEDNLSISGIELR